MSKPLSALLTSRQYLRVATETTKRIGRCPELTRAEYTAELWAPARELYPAKVAQ